MVIIYGISNCDTIRKTRSWLEHHGIAYTFHDYRKDGSSIDLMQEFLKHFDHDMLINRRGTTWRNLPETSKKALNPRSAAKLMSEQPSLVKRPLIKAGRRWLLGYDESQLETLKN